LEIIGAYAVNGSAGAMVDLDFPNAKTSIKGKLIEFANKFAEVVASDGQSNGLASQVGVLGSSDYLQADFENIGVLRPGDPSNENAMRILRVERWVLGEI